MLAASQQDKDSTKIAPKYSDYADVFFLNLAIKLSKNTNINKHAIKLIKSKQLSYGPIYSLDPGELEILKTYVETHQKTGFIQTFNFFADLLIFFDKKPDKILKLYVNY